MDSTNTFHENGSNNIYKEMKIDPNSAFPPKIKEDINDDTVKIDACGVGTINSNDEEEVILREKSELFSKIKF